MFSVGTIVCHPDPLLWTKSFITSAAKSAADGTQLSTSLGTYLEKRRSCSYKVWCAAHINGLFMRGNKDDPLASIRDNSEWPFQFQSNLLEAIFANASQFNFCIHPVIGPSFPHRCCSLEDSPVNVLNANASSRSISRKSDLNRITKIKSSQFIQVIFRTNNVEL